LGAWRDIDTDPSLRWDDGHILEALPEQFGSNRKWRRDLQPVIATKI
jgi:hypothetical protein